MRPREAFVAVTYSCNARCNMCNIWQTGKTAEISPHHYTKLPRSIQTINITGGEPFLRKDLVEVIRAIHSVLPRARIVFSTNGLMTDMILSQIKTIREFHQNVGVGVSIDGMAQVHDKIRGVPGAFERAVKTVRELKGNGFTDLRIAMTLQNDNFDQLEDVYALSKSLGVEFTMTLAHNSEIYFRRNDVRPSEVPESCIQILKKIAEHQLTSRSAKDWVRSYHTMGIADASHRRAYRHHCEAGRMYFFMSPSGDIYPCNVMDKKIGNIAEVDDWESLFTPDSEKELGEAVRSCKNDCWMICNARSLIVAHPIRVGAWVGSRKIRAHVRKLSS